MTRLLVKASLLNNSKIELDGEFHHKLSKVLGLRKGEKVELIDGKGSVYETVIEEISKTKTSLKALNKKYIEKRGTEIILVQAIAKGERFDLIIQKATELGVSKIIPVITSRTIVKIPKEKVDSKVERWREIARHAIEQSGQAWLPEIDAPQTLESFLSSPPKSDLKILFFEAEKEKKLREIWPSKPPSSVITLIGPEGGFDAQEVMQAEGAGFISVSLGQNILRTDTVPMVVLSLIQFLTGELG